VTFLWQLVFSLSLPFQDPGTEIFQRGNKTLQNISFSDEIQCLWDFLGSTQSFTMTAVIKPAHDGIFLKIIRKIIRNPGSGLEPWGQQRPHSVKSQTTRPQGQGRT
jgi:hypothetical protein